MIHSAWEQGMRCSENFGLSVGRRGKFSDGMANLSKVSVGIGVVVRFILEWSFVPRDSSRKVRRRT